MKLEEFTNKFKMLRLINLESLTTTKNEEKKKKDAEKAKAAAENRPAPTSTDFPYITWSDMLTIASELDPDFNWRVIMTPAGESFQLIGGGRFGALVQTEVTFFGKTMQMQAAVTDATGEPVLDHDYSIKKSYDWTDKNTGEVKHVEKPDQIVKALTACDVSNSIMRCLVKNIAEFGLMIDLWKGVRDNKRAKKEDVKKFIELSEDVHDLNLIFNCYKKNSFWNELQEEANEKKESMFKNKTQTRKNTENVLL